MHISGIIISFDILDITVETLSIKALNPVAEEIFPDAIIADEYTGINPSIKFEHSSIKSADDTIRFFTGIIKTEAAERVVITFTTLSVCGKFSQKLCIKLHTITQADIENMALNGSSIFDKRLSYIISNMSLNESSVSFSEERLSIPMVFKNSDVSSERDDKNPLFSAVLRFFSTDS